MRQWIGSAFVQITACRLIGTEPLSEPILYYCSLDHLELQRNLYPNKYIFIQENAFENVVCEMVAIFFPGGDELIVFLTQQDKDYCEYM